MKNSNGIIHYLEKIQKEVDFLNSRSKSFGIENNLIAYRGENKDYGETKLMPSIFRKPKYIENENKLFELLYDYGIIESTVNKNIEKAIESQHYLAISRLLDITFNILSAFFFSCNYSKKEDGYIYIFCFPEHYSPNSNFIEEFYTKILSKDNINSPYSKNFKVISHSRGNERIRAQDGGFIFFPGKEFKAISQVYYRRIRIASYDKERIINELNLIFNIHEAKIYPEKDKFSVYIKEKIDCEYKTDTDITTINELDSCMARLKFETEVLLREGQQSRREVHRILRKEQSDMESYLKNSTDDILTKAGYLKECDKQFNLIKKLI